MVNGQSYIQASTSYNTIQSLSGFARHRPKTLQNATLTDLTKHSQSPPPHGAHCVMNFHSIFLLASLSYTTF
ncbi:hypothetical protein T10_4338 [Trichinella papuae]|uniref:Uncharacterized protein n=1 Tax=Trichinella papuae TaxID=268474 RepID=A0A0V1MSP4_9BILA|nr:hypothetical protein T10_4338 [Trichinella papuae]